MQASDIGDNPVIIVGAGLTGLAVAYRLAERGLGVVVIEQSGRLGGQIHTVREMLSASNPDGFEGGLVIELGAEGFVARSAAVPRLCRDLGIEGELIDQRTTLTYVLEKSTLVPLPPGEAARVLGFQVPREELGRGIRSMRSGMGRLIEALSDAIGDRATYRRGAGVSRVSGVPPHLEVALASGERLAARAVVITAPAPSASEMLSALAPEAARDLAGQRRTSNASATLLYAAARVRHLPDASGFIVPAEEQRDGFRACSFVTTKFDRLIPAGLVLLRAFFRPTVEAIAARGDAGWIELAARSIADPLGVDGTPLRGWASAWPDALPVYDDAWRAAALRAERTLEPLGVHLAGSHFHGAGIDAAVISAERAAERLSRDRAPPPPDPR